MKTFWFILGLSIMILFHADVNAQELECGTVVPAGTTLQQAMPYGDLELLPPLQTPPAVRYPKFRIAVHVISYANGSGAITTQQINDAIDWLNYYYVINNTGITFEKYSTDYIMNDTYASGTFNYDEVRQINTVPHAINVYFVPNFDWAGVSSFSWQQYQGIFINNSYVNTSSFPHEMGHYFDLLHTHDNFFGGENITRDPDDGCYNASTTGDLLADTPADRCLMLGSNYNVNTNCIFAPVHPWAPDACGRTDYNPLTDNLMSYSRKDCRTTFTQQQIQRMRYMIEANRPDLIQVEVKITNKYTTSNLGGTVHVGTQHVASGNALYVPAADNVDIGTDNERFINTPNAPPILKHHNWNNTALDNILTRLKDLINGYYHEDATYKGGVSVTVQNTYIDCPTYHGGQVEVRDPWYVQQNGSQPNQFNTFSAPYTPTGAYNQSQGFVFKDQAYGLNIPHYSVRVPFTQTLNNVEMRFTRWQQTGATVYSQNNLETPVMFLNSGDIVEAVYKANRGSSVSTATSANTQRKMVYYNGKSYLVYESAGEIWLTSSTDNGTTWSNEIMLSNGNGCYSQPSIDAYSNGTVNDGLSVVWQSLWPSGEGDYHLTIFARLSDASATQWGTITPLTPLPSHAPSNFSGATPVIARAYATNEDPDTRITVVYHGWGTHGAGTFDRVYLIYATNHSNSIYDVSEPISLNWYLGSLPTICRKSTDNLVVGLAWKENDNIYYQEFEPRDAFFYGAEIVGYCPEATTGPTLTYTLTTPSQPMIAYQMFDYAYWELYGINIKKRTSSGWNGTSTFYCSGYNDDESPSIEYRGHQDANAYVSWKANGHVWYAKYTTAWQNAQIGFTGNYPNWRCGGDANASYCLAFTTGSTAPYVVNTVKEGFVGGQYKINTDQHHPLHRVDFAHNNRKHAVLYNVAVGSGSNKNHIGFKGEKQSFKNISFSEVFEVTSGMHLFLDIDYGNKVIDISKDSSTAAIPLNLELYDVSDDTRLYTLPLNPVEKVHPSTSYQADISMLAGTTVKLRIASPIWQTDSLKLNETECFFMNGTDSLRNVVGKSTQTIVLEIPKEYNLAQNYPNPFNPVTTIQYSLKSPSSVVLEIFDVLGRKVATLLNTQKPAGMHTIRWDASHASSGLYFYKINVVGESGRLEYQQTRKMLLMK
jgi:hypothetical protein